MFFFVVAVATIYPCTRFVNNQSYTALFLRNLASDKALIGAFVSNLKVINFQFDFKLTVYSFAAFLSIDLPKNLSELLIELLLYFLSELHTPC